MALIVDSQLTALAEDIVPALPGGASSAQKVARDASVLTTKDLVTKIYQYFIDKNVVAGISVDTGALAVGPPVVAPTDGGALLFTGTIVTDLNNKTLAQNDGGSGRIS